MRTAGSGEASQQVRFCRSSDGVTIAYAVHGSGPPLLLNSCWLSHLEHDWSSPVWRHWLVELGRVATVVRYDERGFGMSERDVADFSLDRRVDDLAAVVEHAGLQRFALMAMAQGGPVAIRYTVEHPERVTRLVCADTYPAKFLAKSPDNVLLEEAFQAMIAAGWDRTEPTFRRVFTQMMIPGATEEQMVWMDILHRSSASARTAYEARRQRSTDDVLDLLPRVGVPTLVTHSREDRMIRFENGRRIAADVPGAQLLPLDSGNHILLEDEPAWPVFLAAVTAFLAEDRVRTEDDQPWSLSGREEEVLRLAAAGHDNHAIAALLFLSVRTVERHLQNVYVKLGLHGSSARTAAVARLLQHH